MSDDRYDAEDARRYRRRLKRQRKYQAAYRDRLRQAATPETRDIAAAALEEIIIFMLARPDRAEATARSVARRLPHRFDREEATRRLTQLAARRRAAQEE